MQKRAPTLGNMVVIILFVLSCFGLLLFLWESFGGPVPLKPKQYRFTVGFPKALALAEQSDVRISGVNIGKVVALKAGPEGRAIATIEVSSKYAPIRSDMHAILRQKTLLGETYVQLIPEGTTTSPLPDDGRLPNAQVEPSVTLDGILQTFDPQTRRDFQIWQEALAEAINGRGEQINASFASLEGFSEHGARLLEVLASQEGALRAVIHNTGVVFDALAGRDHQLESLISNGELTFHAAAEESQAFAEAFQALPTFEKRSSVALKEIDRFAVDATPFLKEFQPAERALAPLATALAPFAPRFDSFLTATGPLTAAAKKGLPDVASTLNKTTTILENFRPVLHNLDPFLQFTSGYVPELQAFFANFTAATQSHGHNTNISPHGESGPAQHFLQAMQVLSPESLSVYAQRVGTNRANPYPKPGAFSTLLGGALPVFSTSNCSNPVPSVSGPANENISQSLIEQLIKFKVANAPETPNAIPAPPCVQQAPFSFNGQSSQFPHVVYGGK
jgi:virulence factor Mce-like protein